MAALVVLALGALRLLEDDSPGTLELPIPVIAGDVFLEVNHEGELWRSEAVADLSGRDLMVLVHSFTPDASPASHIDLIDRATGERVGQITAGAYPLVDFDREAGRPIVSDRFFDPATGTGSPASYRLLVFDVAGGLSLQSSTTLPDDRLFVPPQSPLLDEEGQLTLSADERYVYYLQAADDVGIVETDQPDMPKIVHLEDGCRDTSLSRIDASSVIVLCHTRRSAVISVLGRDGALTDRVEAAPPPGVEGSPLGSVAAAFTVGDGIGALFEDGSYAVAQSGTLQPAGRALPEGRVAYVWSGPVLRLDDRHVVLPYWDETVPEDPSQPADGFVVFNTDSEEIEKDVRVENRGTYPLNDHEIAIVNPGRVDILDLTTLRFERSLATSTSGEAPELVAIR
jgi:hypothetical protein